MWLQIKTYDIKTEEDIHKVLINNKIKHVNNVYELTKKNIKCIKKQHKIGMDLFLFEASMVQMTFQKNYPTLLRANSDSYIVCCTNIKNENGEYFSSLIDSLCENDRIILINVIVQSSVNSICFSSKKLFVTVRPENNPSIFLFKDECLLSENTDVLVKNLSQLNNSGTYSLFGCIKRILKYSDINYMLIRIQCNDKSCIKIYKYPHSVLEYAKISNTDKISGVKYDLSSNKVDILIKNPCINFISLMPQQRIFLNNVKVRYSNNLNMYFLHVKGDIENLRADPVETINIKSLRPPTNKFPIPDELRPANGPNKKHTIPNDIQLASKDNLYQKLNKISPSKQFNLSTKQSQYCPRESTNSSSDDNVNLSPCKDFLPSKRICNKNNNVNNGGWICYRNMNDDGISSDSLMKKAIVDSQTDNKIQKCSNSLPIIPLKKDVCSSRENSPDWSTDGSCSPSFFNTQEVSTSNMQPLTINPKNSNARNTPSEVSTSNMQPQTINPQFSNVKKPTKCIGPCRLVFFEPNEFDTIDIVHGYCIKCFAFIQKSFLKTSKMDYKCPKCFNIVKLTFFFKMIFLYGKQEERAIEVCCYNEKAERILTKLTKKTINLESYLLNHDCKKLIDDTIKLMLHNKTKVNIIICNSPNDNTNLLLSIDTKYVVTID